jgi:hypothetical protein
LFQEWSANAGVAKAAASNSAKQQFNVLCIGSLSLVDYLAMALDVLQEL